MFTGFATENTPAIKVWDYSNTAVSDGRFSIGLTDDCAPIQYFKTGGQYNLFSLWIYVYLPSCPIEGKTIVISNARYGLYPQTLNIRSSDVGGSGDSVDVYYVPPGSSVTLIYSKDFISFPSAGSGVQRSGWVPLGYSPASALNAYAYAVGRNAIASEQGAVAITYSGTSSGYYSALVGGDGSTVSGQRAGILSGQSHTASGSYSGVLAGRNAIADSDSSSVVGGQLGTTRGLTGAFVTPASADPFNNFNNGDAQSLRLIMGVLTTGATPTTLKSNPSAASTVNQLVVPTFSAMYFSGSLVAGVSGGGNAKAWTFEGLIKRTSSAASTTSLVQSVINVVGADPGAESWSFALSADTTNGCLKVEVTGQASTTIRWVCRVETTERA